MRRGRNIIVKTLALDPSAAACVTSPYQDTDRIAYQRGYCLMKIPPIQSLSSRNLDKAQLEDGSRWKMRWDFRDQESGFNDVIEPHLSDDEGE